MKYSVVVILFLLLNVIVVTIVFAQSVIKSNPVVTKVGDPKGPPPIIPGGNIGQASCPIPDGKIGCASYGPVREWSGFQGACAPDSNGNGGHCNSIYQSQVGICLTREVGGNLIRTAKSIDVAAPGSEEGNPVYLPTIKGQVLNWEYRGVVSAGSGFGWIRLFKSDPTPEGVYSIHFVHVNQDSPQLSIGQDLKSGDVGATLGSLDWVHVHITIGLNVGDSPDDLKDYSPNWLFADRGLNMCTGKASTQVQTLQSQVTPNQNLIFPISGWQQGVKLHWNEEKGGADFPADKPSNPDQWIGQEVLAVEEGTVEEVNQPSYKGPGGNYVQIINASKTLSYYYAHLSEKRVKIGDSVKGGQVIGTIGKTCFAGSLCNVPYAHLHLGIGPEISFGSGPKGGVGNYDAVGMLCKILGKPTNTRGECP